MGAGDLTAVLLLEMSRIALPRILQTYLILYIALHTEYSACRTNGRGHGILDCRCPSNTCNTADEYRSSEAVAKLSSRGVCIEVLEHT